MVETGVVWCRTPATVVWVAAVLPALAVGQKCHSPNAMNRKLAAPRLLMCTASSCYDPRRGYTCEAHEWTWSMPCIRGEQSGRIVPTR
jgi:hypothetical protein